jgi:Prokaryotic RING finger family 1
MPDRMATPEDVGRPCPYCRFPLKEGVSVHACESCGSVHHAECWGDGGGCAVFGCAAAGAAAASAAQTPAPATQAYAAPSAYQAVAQAPVGYAPPPPPPPYPQQPTTSGMSPWTIALAALVALLGIAAGVAVASGSFSSKGNNATVVTVHQQANPAGSSTSMSSAEEQQKREAVVGVLDAYQRDYTSHSASGLGSIFTEKIKRHGLSGSGCSVVEGRQPVLEDYEQQFNDGTGTYTLIGLSSSQVQLSGPDNAEVHSHYEISPGGAGFVNFKLAASGNEWKISEVYATCA